MECGNVVVHHFKRCTAQIPNQGIAACCARPAIGHAAAEPTRVMNSRRLIRRPRLMTPPNWIRARNCDRRNGPRRSFCAAAIHRAEMSQWVKSDILGVLFDVRCYPQSDRNSDLPGRTNARAKPETACRRAPNPNFKTLPKRYGSALGLSPSLKNAAMRAGRTRLCTSTFAFGN